MKSCAQKIVKMVFEFVGVPIHLEVLSLLSSSLNYRKLLNV